MPTMHRLVSFSLQLTKFLLLLPILLCAPGYAQVTSGSIFGSVKDSSGAYVPNAKVTVQNSSVGLLRTVTTAEAGYFVVTNLPPGKYTIVVEAARFKKLENTDVILSATDRLNAGDLVLAVGAVVESVSVSADAGELQLQSNSGERS
ncbi:MAG: hypothetical protein DMG08_16090, partial [Acidobacteria bacterium]